MNERRKKKKEKKRKTTQKTTMRILNENKFYENISFCLFAFVMLCICCGAEEEGGRWEVGRTRRMNERKKELEWKKFMLMRA